ncbi:MAG: iron-sulfur binding hydrogenase [Kiritimatiellia bacterium]
MKLQNIIKDCSLKVVCLPGKDMQVSRAYTSDLLSDVMGHCPEDSILITIQNHRNTVAVSTLVGARAIVIAHNRDVPDDMKKLAAGEGVALLRSDDDQFTLSCRIGKLLYG